LLTLETGRNVGLHNDHHDKDLLTKSSNRVKSQPLDVSNQRQRGVRSCLPTMPLHAHGVLVREVEAVRETTVVIDRDQLGRYM
jgi:hypothetical protein